MQPIGGEGIPERMEQVSPVHLDVGKAERSLHSLAKWRSQQGAAVLVTPLMPRLRSHAQGGQLSGQADPVQHARRVGTDLDSSADFAYVRHLFVHPHVQARLQQQDGGRKAADSAANDGD